MRLFLINKNLCFYYWLKKRIGKKWACKMAMIIEESILLFGRPKLTEENPGEEPVSLLNCRLNGIKK